jgi:hypothetical protein
MPGDGCLLYKNYTVTVAFHGSVLHTVTAYRSVCAGVSRAWGALWCLSAAAGHAVCRMHDTPCRVQTTHGKTHWGGKYGIVSCHRDVTGALSLVFPPTELPARFRYTTGHLTGEDDLRGRCSARHGIQAAFSRGINTAQGRRTNAYRRRRTASAHASLPLGTMTN